MSSLRKLFALVGLGAVASSATKYADAPKVTPDANRIYPYVVPSEYLEVQPKDSAELTRELGHGLHIVLVHDLDKLVMSVRRADLENLHLTPEQAFTRASKNLEDLVKSGVIEMRAFPSGPGGQPFVLIGGHWAAATAILSGKVHEIAMKALKTSELCASIPHREAMLIFPKGDTGTRKAFRALVLEKEGDGRKPLTFELFTLGSDGVKPFHESK